MELNIIEQTEKLIGSISNKGLKDFQSLGLSNNKFVKKHINNYFSSILYMYRDLYNVDVTKALSMIPNLTESDASYLKTLEFGVIEYLQLESVFDKLYNKGMIVC